MCWRTGYGVHGSPEAHVASCCGVLGETTTHTGKVLSSWSLRLALSTNECTGAQRRATILDRHGVPHDTVLLPREDFPFRQDARSCAAQLGWSAGGEMLAVLPHRCRSIVLWRAITLESQAFEIAHKVFMHRMK